ncbi:hypothetical protein K4H00_24475, partial [Mycobacterium tuberculosis]|nr:hypothetical protein [Mycobacterium tuberculosis]
PITVRTPPVLVSYSQGAVTSTSGPTSEIWVKPSFFPGIRIAPSSGGGATSTQGAYFVGTISIPSGQSPAANGRVRVGEAARQSP